MLIHIRLFIEAYGTGPHLCHWCGDDVSFFNGRGSRSGVVHHVDHDHGNNDLDNLVAGHFGCHSSHHHRGKTVSDEVRAKMSASQKLIPHNPSTIATKAKISQALKGKPKTRDHNQKVSDALRGRQLTDAHKQSLSESQHRHGMIDTWCDLCGAGPFAGNRGLLTHQRCSKICAMKKRDRE